jgi:hypothetical protein
MARRFNPMGTGVSGGSAPARRADLQTSRSSSALKFATEVSIWNLTVQRNNFIFGLGLLLSGILISVLLLGPFLHAHFGASTVTGFHLAEVRKVSLANADSESIAYSAESANETPAVGVGSFASSNDHSLSGNLPVWIALAFWICFLTLEPPARFGARCAFDSPPRRLAYRAGLPPPVLAPPTRNS